MGQTQRVSGRSTHIETGDDGIIRVMYHSTAVVSIFPNGRIDLNTGGWWSFTTKTRMNQAANQYKLGFQVYQEDHEWFIAVDGQVIEFRQPRVTIRNGSDFGRDPSWSPVEPPAANQTIPATYGHR